MAFSSGVFSLVSGNPVVTGTVISSTTHNDTMEDIADNGLSLCILKDGTQTITGNITLSNFRITNLGAATARTDAARVSQAQDGVYGLLTSVTGTNTIAASATPQITAYAEGQVFLLNPVNSNTADATINIDSVGAAPIFWNAATATSGIIRNKQPILLAYRTTASATGFHVVGNSGFLPVGLVSARGDLFCGATANNVMILPRGADDRVLVATASASAGMAWKAALNLTSIDVSATCSCSTLVANGGTLAGTFAGTPTFSGAVTFGDHITLADGNGIAWTSGIADTYITGNSSTNQISIGAGGTQAALFTSTGINSAAIGATTRSTGAFSSLIVDTHTPASATATGTAGRIAWDGSFIYICTATDTWERVAIATW